MLHVCARNLQDLAPLHVRALGGGLFLHPDVGSLYSLTWMAHNPGPHNLGPHNLEQITSKDVQHCVMFRRDDFSELITNGQARTIFWTWYT